MPKLPLQIVSDLHLEFRTRTYMQEVRSIIPAAPNLALLGDIMNLTDQNMVFEVLEDLCSRWTKVFYVVGNHEYYGCDDMEEALDSLKSIQTKFSNLKVLDNESVELNGTMIFGGTMWSLVTNSEAVTSYINDYRKIPGFTTELNNELHRVFLDDLVNVAKTCESKKMPLVVLTHHAPLVECTSHPYYLEQGKVRGTNEAFATDLTRILNRPIVFWGFGHTHYCCDFNYNDIRIYSNAKGYGGSDLRSRQHYNRGKILLI